MYTRNRFDVLVVFQWPIELMHNISNNYFYPLLKTSPELIGSYVTRAGNKAFDVAHETEK